MTTRLLTRRLASFAGTLLLGLAAAFASAGPASAFDLHYSSWDSGTEVLLTSAETGAAVADGTYFTGPLCGDAITRAVQSGIPFPDAARSSCQLAVSLCAKDARMNNRALSGTRLFADGSHRCLVR